MNASNKNLPCWEHHEAITRGVLMCRSYIRAVELIEFPAGSFDQGMPVRQKGAEIVAHIVVIRDVGADGHVPFCRWLYAPSFAFWDAAGRKDRAIRHQKRRTNFTGRAVRLLCAKTEA
ncbi:MAG: hypothetical protein WDM89_04640 [Rhizomicrobium sp.]